MNCTEETLNSFKVNKTPVRVFLMDPQKKVMLEGQIMKYDDKTFVLNKCLVYQDKVISIDPK